MPQSLSKFLTPEDNQERCGLILGNGRAIEVKNIAPEPANSFEIAPEQMIKPGRRVTGTWHTHPGGKANLSHEDYAGFLNWPNLTHYIIGVDGVRGYKVQDGLVVNVS